MLSRRTLIASTAVLAAGCSFLEPSAVLPGISRESALTWVAIPAFAGYIDMLGAGRETLTHQALAALEKDEENPNGPKKGKYGLTLQYIPEMVGVDDLLALLDDLEADLVTVSPTMAAVLSEKGVLLPLDRLLDADGPALRQSFFPSLVEQFQFGETYALPVDALPIVLYYDAAYFIEEQITSPVASNWDWNDLVESALKLTRRKEDGTVARWGLEAHGKHLWWALWQNEAEAVDPLTAQCRLQEPAAIEALQFFRDLLHVHRVSPVALYAELSQLVYPPVGLPPAMVYSYPSMQPTRGDYRIAEIPRGKVRSVPVYGDMGIAIAARTAKPEAAYTALKGLVESLQTFMRVPAKKEVLARLGEHRPDLQPEEISAIQRSMEHGRAWPQNESAWQAMHTVREGLVRGDDVVSVANQACSVLYENR